MTAIGNVAKIFSAKGAGEQDVTGQEIGHLQSNVSRLSELMAQKSLQHNDIMQRGLQGYLMREPEVL